jgi:hypothetical protein
MCFVTRLNRGNGEKWRFISKAVKSPCVSGPMQAPKQPIQKRTEIPPRGFSILPMSVQAREMPRIDRNPMVKFRFTDPMVNSTCESLISNPDPPRLGLLTVNQVDGNPGGEGLPHAIFCPLALG